MSDFSQGPGWWQASDDKWYPPDQVPGPDPTWGGATGSDPTSSWGTASASGPSSSDAPSDGPPGYGPVGGYAPLGAYGTGFGLPSSQGIATASMVLGIVALLLFWCWFLAALPALVAVTLGTIALTQINNETMAPDGKGMAIAGVVCGGLSLLAVLAAVLLITVR